MSEQTLKILFFFFFHSENIETGCMPVNYLIWAARKLQLKTIVSLWFLYIYIYIYIMSIKHKKQPWTECPGSVVLAGERSFRGYKMVIGAVLNSNTRDLYHTAPAVKSFKMSPLICIFSQMEHKLGKAKQTFQVFINPQESSAAELSSSHPFILNRYKRDLELTPMCSPTSSRGTSPLYRIVWNSWSRSHSGAKGKDPPVPIYWAARKSNRDQALPSITHPSLKWEEEIGFSERKKSGQGNERNL